MIIPGSLSDERLEQLSVERDLRERISPSLTTPASSSSVKRADFGLSMSSTPSNSPSRINGTTISLFEALSQAMWPAKAWTSSTRWTCRLFAAAPQTPSSKLMRMHAGRPWNGPTSSSPPILR